MSFNCSAGSVSIWCENWYLMTRLSINCGQGWPGQTPWWASIYVCFERVVGGGWELDEDTPIVLAVTAGRPRSPSEAPKAPEARLQQWVRGPPGRENPGPGQWALGAWGPWEQLTGPSGPESRDPDTRLSPEGDTQRCGCRQCLPPCSCLCFCLSACRARTHTHTHTHTQTHAHTNTCTHARKWQQKGDLRRVRRKKLVRKFLCILGGKRVVRFPSNVAWSWTKFTENP